MAYGDYIHCADCDCKLIYDGYRNIREGLDDEYDEWELLCPGCLKKLRERLKALEGK